MQRFIYDANAFAAGGRITRPIDYTIDAAAAAVLPSTGGKATANVGPFKLETPEEFLLSWDGGETTITGGEDNGAFVTEINSVLRGLNVGNTLKIDEITLHLLVRYDKAARKPAMDCSGSGYKGVNLGGRVFDVTIDSDMGKKGSDFDKFHHDHPNYPFSGGKVHYALGRNPDLIFEGDDCGMYVQPNFGKLYFAEWTCGPGIQNLTMLRLRLGSPQEGDLETGGGTGNGVPFP